MNHFQELPPWKGLPLDTEGMSEPGIAIDQGQPDVQLGDADARTVEQRAEKIKGLGVVTDGLWTTRRGHPSLNREHGEHLPGHSSDGVGVSHFPAVTVVTNRACVCKGLTLLWFRLSWSDG